MFLSGKIIRLLTILLNVHYSFQSPAAVYNEDPNLLYPFVKSPAGNFVGLALPSRLGKWYNEFRGIPYAETPRRFEPSMLAKPFTAVYDARNHKPMCAQAGGSTGIQGSEDCLFLSVAYPHQDRCKNETQPESLPVMVNIHGGGFTSGAGSIYGGKYLLDKCVVYVSINYRLGAFGFLSTSDGVIPGNLGLKDQIVALKWVQNNIGSFRGDPKSVTIFGISAGGSSVSHQVTSPAAKGLFHRAIPQSGVSLNPWSVIKYPDNIAKSVANALKCSTASSSQILQCLKSKSMNDIISNSGASGELAPFGPVIERDSVPEPFQTQHPAKRLQSGDFNRVPIMAGFTEDEGIFVIAITKALQGNSAMLNSNWNMIAPKLLFYDKWDISSAEKNEISEKIRKFYFNGKPIGEETRQNLTNMFSDRFFVQGVFSNVELHSKFAPAYPYVMSYKGGFSGAIGLGYMVPASTHGDDGQYLFNTANEYPFGTEQNEFSRNMVSLWTSFATTGKPVSDALEVEKWEPAVPGKGNARWFDLTVPVKTLSNYLEERRQFWKSLKSDKYDVY